jgi:serine phosphatase RsbU (regulator of sigma subunit)/uncharacterized protein YigA (DUF484 family)
LRRQNIEPLPSFAVGDPNPDEAFTRSQGSDTRKTRGELSAVQRLVLVQGVAERLAGSRELFEMADAVVDLARVHLGSTAVTIAVFDSHRSTLVPLRTDGEPEVIDALMHASATMGRRLAHEPTGASGLFGATRSRPDPNSGDDGMLTPSKSLQSWAVLPLVARDEAIGIVAFGWEQRRRPRPADTAMLSAIAHQCALAIDRTRVIEAERGERETLEFLAAATRLMVSAVDPNDVVRRLVQLAVPRLAPWCAVYVSGDDRLERVAIEVSGHGRLAEALRRSNPIPITSDSPVAVSYRTGDVQIVSSVTRAMVAQTYEPDLAALVLSLPGDSWCAIAVPVYSSGRVIGVMSLVSNAWNGTPPDDVRLAAEGLAGRAGVALANARRFESEHRMARLLAEALMPAQVPVVPGFSAAARYIPTGGPVAGDWFEVSRLPTGDFLIGVGDAAGHGVEATSLMALLRSAAQGLAVAGHGPAGVLEGLNKLVAEHEDEGFATALYSCLDVSSGKLQWSSAGHIPPLWFHDRDAQFISAPANPPLGLTGGLQDVHALQIEPGDGLVLVTDGVVERRHWSIHHGMQRLADVVTAPPSLSAELIADRIAGELCQAPEDDCCIVVIVRDDDQ